MSKEYNSSNIKVLEGLEAVRKRPGMYIGNTGIEGLHHLIWEISDNSVDEAGAGFGNKIIVSRSLDNVITIEDEGRGIPVDKHETGKSALEVIFTVLHAGGKFDSETYKTSGGLHGVGASVTNALSEWLEVEVSRNNKIYKQRYEKGIPVHDLKIIGESSKTGTKVSFKPDIEIFKHGIQFEDKRIEERLNELAFLNKNLEFVFKFETESGWNEKVFSYKNGLLDFINFELNGKKSLINPLHFEGNEFSTEVEIAFTFEQKGFSTNIKSFVNNIRTREAGSHENGSLGGLFSALQQQMKEKDIKKNESIKIEDFKEGLICIISVKVIEPEFEGQTKGRLNDSNARKATFKIAKENFYTYLEENPKKFKDIVKKIQTAQKAREAAKKSREMIRKTDMDKGVGILPSKLADCQSNNAEECEIFLVEGDSAGGCFTIDTKVALADGRNLSFGDLIKEDKLGKKNFCYTIKKNGKIGIEEIINPRLTKKNAKLIKITLDNGEEIKCTLDHKFMLSNGKYKEAKDLKINSSLMPLNKNISKEEGYEGVFCKKRNKFVFTHALANKWNLENGIYKDLKNSYKHHKDFNKKNNNPTNIELLTSEEYSELYKINITKTLHKSLLKLKSLYESLDKDPLTIKNKEIVFSLYEKERKLYKDKSVLKIETLIKKFYEGSCIDLLRAIDNFNHKVVSIELIENNEDVFDIEVPNSHNFALASGVFVHNSAKQGRNRKIQAILPFKGKVLNVLKASESDILKQPEIQTLITALGCGVGKDFDINKLRYHKIIIMTDADVDGEHIAFLFFLVFFKLLRPLIEGGYLYLAVPPLYRAKKSDQVKYFSDSDQMLDFFLKVNKKKRGSLEELSKGWVITRFKGLGEMNPDQLAETAMKEETRKVIQVTIPKESSEGELSTEEVLEYLGGTNVKFRRWFLMKYTSEVDLS